MPQVKTVWRAWEGDAVLSLDFPPEWHVSDFDVAEAAALTRPAIAAAFETTVGPPMEERFPRPGPVAIAVEDLTRPAYLGDALEALVARLARLGFRDKDFRFIVSTGAHRPLLRRDLLRKLGEVIVGRFAIENHQPYENLVSRGVSQRGTVVSVNRTFVESEYRVVVGSVLPHPYTGFSGGAKLVVPGLAGIDTIEATHRMVVGGAGGLNNPEINLVRAELEHIVDAIGVTLGVHLTIGRRRSLVRCTVGDIVEGHRLAVDAARRLYTVPRLPKPVDVLVLNSYPKDTEMLQIGNVLNVVRSHGDTDCLVTQEGTVVVLASCPEGRGYHALHQPGGRVYRLPVQRTREIGEREIVLLSDTVNEYDFHVSFWSGYRLCHDWGAVRAHLLHTHGPQASAAVFHAASIQLFEAAA